MKLAETIDGAAASRFSKCGAQQPVASPLALRCSLALVILGSVSALLVVAWLAADTARLETKVMMDSAPVDDSEWTCKPMVPSSGRAESGRPRRDALLWYDVRATRAECLRFLADFQPCNGLRDSGDWSMTASLEFPGAPFGTVDAARAVFVSFPRSHRTRVSIHVDKSNENVVSACLAVTMSWCDSLLRTPPFLCSRTVPPGPLAVAAVALANTQLVLATLTTALLVLLPVLSRFGRTATALRWVATPQAVPQTTVAPAAGATNDSAAAALPASAEAEPPSQQPGGQRQMLHRRLAAALDTVALSHFCKCAAQVPVASKRVLRFALVVAFAASIAALILAGMAAARAQRLESKLVVEAADVPFNETGWTCDALLVGDGGVRSPGYSDSGVAVHWEVEWHGVRTTTQECAAFVVEAQPCEASKMTPSPPTTGGFSMHIRFPGAPRGLLDPALVQFGSSAGDSTPTQVFLAASADDPASIPSVEDLCRDMLDQFCTEAGTRPPFLCSRAVPPDALDISTAAYASAQIVLTALTAALLVALPALARASRRWRVLRFFAPADSEKGAVTKTAASTPAKQAGVSSVLDALALSRFCKCGARQAVASARALRLAFGVALSAAVVTLMVGAIVTARTTRLETKLFVNVTEAEMDSSQDWRCDALVPGGHFAQAEEGAYLTWRGVQATPKTCSAFLAAAQPCTHLIASSYDGTFEITIMFREGVYGRLSASHVLYNAQAMAEGNQRGALVELSTPLKGAGERQRAEEMCMHALGQWCELLAGWPPFSCTREVHATLVEIAATAFANAKAVLAVLTAAFLAVLPILARRGKDRKALRWLAIEVEMQEHLEGCATVVHVNPLQQVVSARHEERV